MPSSVEEIVREYSYVGMSGGLVTMLQRSLYPDEEPCYAHNGLIRKDDSRMEGIVLVTQKRVLCCTRKLIAKELSEIPLLNIRGMQIRKGKEWVQRELHIESLSETIIVIADMGRLRKLQVAIQTVIDGYEEFNRSGSQKVPAVEINVQKDAGSDLDEQLRTLKKLCDDGIITQEEFEAKKKQVLGL